MTTTRIARNEKTSLWGYLGLILLSPRNAFEQLMADERRVQLGSWAVGLVAFGYTVSLVLWFLIGGRSRISPWLAIPLESYFFWEIFFIGIVTICCWILASGVVYLLGKQVGGAGRFEDTLSMLGFAITVPTLAPLVIDLILGLVIALGLADASSWTNAMSAPGFWMLLMLVYMLSYLIGLMVLFPIATKAAQNMSGWKALWLGLVGVVVYQGVYFIFVR